MRAIAAMLCACLLSACSGNGKGLDENGRPIQSTDSGELTATFDSIQQHVFTPICTACHTGATAPLGLRLDEGVSYAMLVNVASVEDPTHKRIEPGNADASYLVHKIEGTAAVGGRMPLGGAPLPPATIAVIRQWISEGAQPSASLSADHLSKLTSAWPPQGAHIASPRELIVTADGELDTTTLTNSIELLRVNADASVGSGIEQVVPIKTEITNLSPTVFAVVPQIALSAGQYELHINSDTSLRVTDLAGRVVSADQDTNVGGTFVLHFTVEE
jgi:hypothetical protein